MLKQMNLDVKFVTNTTKESRRELLERLTKLGFDIKAEDIFSSLSAARRLVDHEKLKPMLLIDDRAMEDFLGVDSFEGEPNAVVIGLAPDKFNYESMNKAFRVLLEGGRLVAIHEGRYLRLADGRLALGPGPFVRALSYAASATPTVVGKPSPDFFISALAGTDPISAVMIGDDVRDDIQGAGKVGIAGILVQTGKYRPGDERLIDANLQTVLPNFSEAVNLILSHAGTRP